MPKEEPTSRTSRIRGGLPGDSWKPYISEGTRKVYDEKLTGSREEAKKLRHKGRLVAAHRAEKRAYKIRVRGYDRKRRGEQPLGKAFTSKTLKIGPYRKSTKELRIRPLSRSENRRQNLIAAGKAVGGFRTVAAVGAGAGVSEVVQNSQDKAKQTTRATGNIIRSAGRKEEVVASKSLDIYQIIGKSYEDNSYESGGLVDINKALGWGAIKGGADELFRGAKQSYQQGFGRTEAGLGGLKEYGRSVAAPYIGSTGAKAGAGGAGAAGAAGLGYMGYKAATSAAKKKALKYGGYAALGTAGAVGTGVAAGNMISR